MKEKKLTDEEIVKALDNDCLCVVYGVDCESCPLREKDCKILPEAIKDLIHRLQSENKELRTESDRMVAEHLAFVELAKKADEQQKAEIERLTAFKNEAISMSLYGKGRKDGEAVAVKDTAKEILQELLKWLNQSISFSNGKSLNGSIQYGAMNKAYHEVKRRVKKIAESKGVEVE